MGPTDIVMSTIACKRATRALEAGDVERAVRIAERYRKLSPREPGAYLLEYITKTQRPAVDRRALLQMLRTGWQRGPYHSGLADALLTELFREECTRPNPALIAEARRVVDQFVAVYGDSPWSNLWLGEIAQLDGDWVSAKQYVEITLPMLETGDSRMLKGFLRAGMSLASIPGEESRGELMVLDSIERYPGPWAHVVYAIVVEHRDPERAKEHLNEARKLCDGSPESFDKGVEATREAHRRNMQRLALVSSL